MHKGAFIGSADAFGAGAGAFAASGLGVAAFCPAGNGRGGLTFPEGAVSRKTAAGLFAEPGLTFAAVSLPPAESFEAVQLALARGLHVFCEPPFCRSLAELETLTAAAMKAGKTLFPAQPWERSPSCRALEKALTRGLAGELNFACVRLALAGPAPADWGVSPAAWQAASLLLGSVRRPPAAVEARLLPGSAAFHVHFGGADGFMHLSAGAPQARLTVSVSGDKGRVELDGGLLRLEPAGLPPETVELSAAAVPGFCRPDWLKAELSDFKREMEGTRPACTGLRNARYCLKLLKNAAASAVNRSAAIPL